MGTSQANCALLAVDCSVAGMVRDVQMREHALMVYMVGVKKMVVAMNKMDQASIATGHRTGR